MGALIRYLVSRGALLLGAAPLLLPAAAAAQAPERQLVGEPEPVGDGLTYPLDPGRLGLRLPRVVGDNALDRRLHSPMTVFYKLPQVYQPWTPAGRSELKDPVLGTTRYEERPAVWNILSTGVLPQFNANPDFPWEATLGLNLPHRNKQIGPLYDVINFLSLPEDEDGNPIPVVVLDERPVKWLYPPGTTFGEIIYVKHKGRAYVQEVRTRTKSANATTWHPRVYRPVRDRQELQQLTGIAYAASRRFLHLRNTEEDEVFRIDGIVERLPALPEAVVTRLLLRPFQDVTDSNWSPASDTEFNLLPKDYSLGLIKEVTSEACAQCHRQTSISVRRLIPKEPLIYQNPTRVGNIRGSDGIFSWYPFAARSVGHDADTFPGRDIYLRRFDAENRLVVIVPRGQAPQREYKLTKYVQASLAPHELPAAAFLHPGVTPCDCLDKDCDCTVGECKCNHPRPWRPLIDNRRLVADTGTGFTSVTPAGNVQQPPRQQPQPPPAPTPQRQQPQAQAQPPAAPAAQRSQTSPQFAAAPPAQAPRLEWTRDGAAQLLYSYAEGRYLGRYLNGQYRLMTPVNAEQGQYLLGQESTPPIPPLPE